MAQTKNINIDMTGKKILQGTDNVSSGEEAETTEQEKPSDIDVDREPTPIKEGQEQGHTITFNDAQFLKIKESFALAIQSREFGQFNVVLNKDPLKEFAAKHDEWVFLQISNKNNFY